MPVQLLEMYLKWFGVDVAGGYVSEAVMRSLLKDVAWLMANKGTRQCIDRLCELFIGEKPIILERSMMSRYLRYSETEVYNNLYGDYESNVLYINNLPKTNITIATKNKVT